MDRLRNLLDWFRPMGIRFVIVRMLLAVAGSFHMLRSQDDRTINELNGLIQQMAQGGDTCPYLPRMKALIKQLATENPDLYTAMGPVLAELDKPRASCDAPPARVKKPEPPLPPVTERVTPRRVEPGRPQVSLPPGTAFALPPDAMPGSPLDRDASQQILRQVNQARASLRGVNQLPLPTGRITVQSTGYFALNTSGGRQLLVRNTGAIVAVESPAASASFRPDGQPAYVSLASITIYQGPHGERTVVNRHDGETLLVNTGPKSGYVQEGFGRHGASYLGRTYVNGTQRTTRLYAVSSVAGRPTATYIPRVTYGPAFYDWINGSWDNANPRSWQWISDQVYASSLATSHPMQTT